MTGLGVERTADLSNAHDATLTLDAWKGGIGSGHVSVQVSTNGSTWTTLANLDFDALSTSRNSFNYDISGHMSATTTVRLVGSGTVGGVLLSGYYWLDNISINYTPNTDPVAALTGGSATFTEDLGPVNIDVGAVVADAESPDFDGGTLTVDFTAGASANDRLSIQNQGTGAGQVGVSGSNVTYGGVTVGAFAGGTDGSTPLTVTFNNNADAAVVQAVTRAVTFENVSEDPSTANRTVRFVVTDGDGGTSSAVSRSVQVISVNDTPLVGVNTGAAVAEGGTVTITSAMLNEADVDDAGAGLTYTITSGPTNGQLELTTSPGVPIIAFTQDDIDNNRVIFVHDGTQATTDAFDFSLSDGGEDGATAAAGTFNFTIGNVNDAPVAASIEGTALAYTENDGAVAITSTITFTDVDDTNVESAIVRFTSGYNNAEDLLSFTDQSGITGFWNGATGELTLTGSATLAEYETAVRSITYANSSENPDTATRTISFTVNDGDTDSNTLTRDINISRINDEEVLATNAGAAVDEASAGNVITTAMLQATDLDNSAAQLVYTITAATGNGTLRLSGTALGVSDTFTQAEIDAGLVTYDHDGSETVADLFDFSVDDGTGASTAGTFNIAVNPVNDEELLATNLGATVNEASTGNVITTANAGGDRR